MVQGYQSGLLLGTPSVSASSTHTAVSLVPVLLPPGELFPLGLWVSQICVSPSISAPPPISPSFFASSVLPPAPSLFPHLPPTLSVWLLFLPDPHLSPASQTCLLSGTGALSCCPLQVCPHPPGCVTGSVPCWGKQVELPTRPWEVREWQRDEGEERISYGPQEKRPSCPASVYPRGGGEDTRAQGM